MFEKARGISALTAECRLQACKYAQRSRVLSSYCISMHIYLQHLHVHVQVDISIPRPDRYAPAGSQPPPAIRTSHHGMAWLSTFAHFRVASGHHLIMLLPMLPQASVDAGVYLVPWGFLSF